MRFIERFERISGVLKAYFLPNKLHLTIFYDSPKNEELIKRNVLREINFSGFEKSVETLSFYPEERGVSNGL